jgi:hypothetical protein
MDNVHICDSFINKTAVHMCKIFVGHLEKYGVLFEKSIVK